MRQKCCAALLALALILVIAPSAAATGRYVDVPDNHWAAGYVESAAQYGIMEGMGDGQFGLGRNIKRSEFAALLCKFFQWDLVQPQSASFSDCPLNQWYTPYVETLVAQGVVTPGGEYRPTEAITRQDMAVLLVRALGYDELAQWASSLSVPFADVTEYVGYIAIAYDIGMVDGMTENGRQVFKPNNTATREQAAAMMVRVYERYRSDIDWLHAFYATSSYSQIDLTADLDGVSVGWARLVMDEAGAPSVSGDDRDWKKPASSALATDFFAAAGTDCNLTVYGNDAAAFATPELRDAAVTALVAAARDYAGLTMDIEGLKAASKESYTALLTQLRAALPAEQTLYVCVQPDTWFDGYDYRALGEICDKVIVMAHDYEWSVPAYYVGTSRTENPGAPLTQIYDTLRDVTDPETGVADRSKLALAISIDSVGFQVDGEGKILSQTLYHPAPATIIQRLRQADTEMGYSNLYGTPYIYYTTQDGSRYRLWYEDARSVTAKIQLARMFGINGISFWRLGNIPTYDDEGLYYDVWSAVKAQR
jgi:hypothetical protein